MMRKILKGHSKSRFIPLKRYFTSSSQLYNHSKPLFDKILIANRGEIACRVINTCKKLGVKSVAVFSEADAHSRHVQLADEAYCIGPPESSKSYLCGDKILQVAKRAGAQAIHPGYGFLSENEKFAEMCKQQGIVFIGPPAKAIKAMGSKKESKELMEKAKVPVVPGYWGTDQSNETLLKEADRIGYPVLIKAVMGGGGKGMKIVHSRDEFLEQLSSAKREALNHFADENVLLERYLTHPRHVEIQVFADTFGNAVYLFERDCSLQRRHQKVIEEAPAPGLTPELRKNMGEKAVAAAKAVGYVGAGTVEFIFQDGEFYFMEMNTRLQVEHPVTEMITGLDLVEWQLRVASGNELPMKQEQLTFNGHSFEARIYAEAPENGFLPCTGTLKYLKAPQEVPNYVRNETGVRQGDEISIYYDPMIAKLVVWGKDRDDALKRLKNQLDEYHIVGLPTNIEFLKRCLMHPKFKSGEVETNFIPKYKDELLAPRTIGDHVYILGALGVILDEKEKNIQQAKKTEDPNSPWVTTSVVLNEPYSHKITFLQDKKPLLFTINDLYNGAFSIQHNNQTFTISTTYNQKTHELIAYINDRRYKAEVVVIDNTVSVFVDGETFTLELPKVSFVTEGKTNVGSLVSPMPGKIIQVSVKPDDFVQKGQTLVIMEAMKMEHTIRAPTSGVVKKVHHKAGDKIGKDVLLVEVEPVVEKQNEQ